MKKKYWKIYSIVYEGSKSGPSEVIVNFDDYEWSKDIPVGPFNLNTKIAKAIKEVTGLDIRSCKADVIYLD